MVSVVYDKIDSGSGRQELAIRAFDHAPDLNGGEASVTHSKHANWQFEVMMIRHDLWLSARQENEEITSCRNLHYSIGENEERIMRTGSVRRAWGDRFESRRPTAPA
jgi:hypothetical protein